jgi:hypothetical protein
VDAGAALVCWGMVTTAANKVPAKRAVKEIEMYLFSLIVIDPKVPSDIREKSRNRQNMVNS